MLIQIINGTYGYRDGSRVVPKRPGDAPFEVSEERGQKLIDKGVAARATSMSVDDEFIDDIDIPVDPDPEPEFDPTLEPILEPAAKPKAPKTKAPKTAVSNEV